MEPNTGRTSSSSGQVAVRGLLLVLVLVVIGAFLLANALDDDTSSTDEAAVSDDAGDDSGDDSATSDTSDDAGDDSGDDSATSDTSDDAGDDSGDDSATSDTSDDAGDDSATGDTEDPLTCRDPAEVTVLVANGTDINGAAGRLTATLISSNYATLSPANAPIAQAASSAYYRPGFQDDAFCLADVLSLDTASVFPISDPPPGGVTADLAVNVNILVLIGSDGLAVPG